MKSDVSPLALLRNWDSETNKIPPEGSILPHLFELQSLRLLARGEPVSAEMVAAKLGIPTELARSVFESSRGKGEWDGEGRLIGSALTLVPTAHRFKIGDRDLYTWCAQDTIFLPGLLGVTAEVISPDPQTGELIKVIMGPSGPTEYTPETAVVTFLEAAEPAVGPESAVCTNSHYFTSEASAAEWSRNRPGITILSVEDAFARMKKNLLDALQPILDQMG